MVRLVDRENRVYHLGATYLCGGVTSWRVKYWISPTNEGSKWEIRRLGEGQDEPDIEEVVPADEVRWYVEERLGFEVTVKEWRRMGLNEGLLNENR